MITNRSAFIMSFIRDGYETWQCPKCERTFGTLKGAEIHNGRMHETRTHNTGYWVCKMPKWAG